MLNKNLNDYIVVFENVLTNALCDAILEEFSVEDEWQKTVVGVGEVNEQIRNVETIVISYPNVINKNLKTRENLDKYIYICTNNVIMKYNKKFPLCNIEEDS